MVCGSHFSNSDSVTYGVGTPTPKAPFYTEVGVGPTPNASEFREIIRKKISIRNGVGV